MSTYYDQLEALLDGSAGGDRDIRSADCIYFDFRGGPVRLWAGIGVMITPDGARWQGFYGHDDGGRLRTLFDMQVLKDVRDGTSPLHELTLEHLDRATYLACRDERDQVRGRDVLISSVIMPAKGARALTLPGDTRRLQMLDTKFSEQTRRVGTGRAVVSRSVTVVAKNLNAGRSQTHFGTLSDTVQRARSLQVHGVENDHYCQFCGKYANGYTVKVF